MQRYNTHLIAEYIREHKINIENFAWRSGIKRYRLMRIIGQNYDVQVRDVIGVSRALGIPVARFVNFDAFEIESFREIRLLCCALAIDFVENHGGCIGYVEAIDFSAHWDGYYAIDEGTGEGANACVLAPHDYCDGTREVGFGYVYPTHVGGENPETLGFEVFDFLVNIGYFANADVTCCAGTHTDYRFGDGSGTVFRDNDSVYTHAFGGSDNVSEVMHILYTVEDKYKRMSAFFVPLINNVGKGVVLEITHERDETLVVFVA